MKVLISILIVLGVIFAGWKGYDYWDRVNTERDKSERKASGADLNPNNLPGMPYQIAEKYRIASQNGPAAMKSFLDAFAKAPSFQDPRKAWIEMDYIVSITGSDPIEAKTRFAAVKARVSTNSPIYFRIRALEKTYE
jgi:hypothetical protein